MNINGRALQSLTALAVSLLFIQTAAAQVNTWTNAGLLNDARYSHTATLLPNGQVLVAGGIDNSGNPTTSAELYNPATGMWTTTGSLNTARYEHTATLLPNGEVLVAGGYDNSGNPATSAELYNPATGTWTTTGSLNTARYEHTATLLPNGEVLVAGGDGASGVLSSAELYNPASGTWTTTGSLNTARAYQTAALLPNGQVLVAGGLGNSFNAIASAELYNPASGTWTTTGPLNNARFFHMATLLPNGQVLAAGGFGSSGLVSSAELYNPASGTWAVTGSLNTACFAATASLLPNGQVLVAGGLGSSFSATASAELYNPTNGTWTTTGSLNTARYFDTATLLPNGQVLVAGGSGSSGLVSSAELYNSASAIWTNTGSMTTACEWHTATLLPNGQVLVAGGYGDSGYLSNAQLYNPANGTWSNSGSLSNAFCLHTATLLRNGQVLVAGGYGNSGFLSSAQLYNPASGTWTPTASLNNARCYHTATLLPNGQVLVVGGLSNGVYLASAELYNPISGTWTNTGSLNTARYSHTATLLPNGQVLVAGGYGNNGMLNSSELYNPITGTWTVTGSLNVARYGHTATLLPNGLVLVAGGDAIGNSAELYNLTTGVWTMTGSLNTARGYQTATLLPDGQVLVAGGYNGNGALTNAEVYNPASGKWTITASLNAGRYGHTATLLPNGQVLIAGGYNDNSGYLTDAELYNVGLGFNASWQPQITSFIPPLVNNGCLTLTGSQFWGVSEASSGNSASSPADYPVVQLLSLANEQTLFLSSTNWSANSWISLAMTNYPPGWVLATMFVNGIPSQSILLCPTVAQPSVLTELATDVSLTTATLNGTATPNNLPSSAWFNWGTTTNYGANTTPVNIGYGATPVPLSASLAGLNPLTTYHYRIVAGNSAGTNYGADQIFFTTINNNAALAGLTLSAGTLTPAFASNITNFNDTVTNVGSLTVTPTSADPHATIQISVNGGAWTPIASGTASSPFTITLGLNTLQVQVTAQNDVTIQTYNVTIDSEAPPVIGTQLASGIGNISVTLNGTVNPNGLPTSVWFNWGTTTNYGASTPPISAGSGFVLVHLSASLTGLAPNTTYHFQAVAGNAAGTNYGYDMSFTTLLPGIDMVNWGSVGQKIDGFGASSAWQNNWTLSQANLFFSTNNGFLYTNELGDVTTNNGAGLSLLRNHITYAGSTSASAIPTTGETSIMQWAQALGARVWSTPWTPPAGFKSTSDIYDSGTAGDGGIDGGSYLGGTVNNQAYASQLANYVVSMKNQGINIYAISVQNEPDADVTSYEACQWSSANISAFVPYLYDALTNAGVGSTKIIIPESQNWTDPKGLASTALGTPSVAADVGIVACHDYVANNEVGDTTTPSQLYASSGKTSWETEVAQIGGNYDGSITNGLYWAQRIHLYLTAAQVSAWHYWWLISENADNEGLTDVYGNPAKRLFVLGQFSRFVRPGYYRIGVNTSGDALVSAYDNTNSGNFAIVAINSYSGSLSQTFNLTNFPGLVSSVTPWITSASNSLASLPSVSVSGSSFTYMLPPQSVMTFVGQSVAVPSTNIVITSTRYVGGGSSFVLTWNATAGANYSVLKTNVVNGSANWPAIVTGYPAGGAAGGPLSYTDTTVTATPAFYRVRSP